MHVYVCMFVFIFCACTYMQGQALQVFLLGGPGWAGPFAANKTALESAPVSSDSALPTKRRPDGEAGHDAPHLHDVLRLENVLHVEAIHDAHLGEARHDTAHSLGAPSLDTAHSLGAPSLDTAHVQPRNDGLDGVSRDGALHTPLVPHIYYIHISVTRCITYIYL